MSNDIESLLARARRAKELGENSDAAYYYKQVLMEDPNNWEAVFYYEYCKSATCVIANIEFAAERVGVAFQKSFNLIQRSSLDKSLKELYRVNYATEALFLLMAMWQSALHHKSEFFDAYNANYEYMCRAKACGAAAKVMGDCFYRIGETQMAATCFEQAYSLSDGKVTLTDQEIACIKQHIPDFKLKSSGCYVATAVYGSYDCPEVWTLRRYRDTTLASTWYGRAFIKTYYAISPTLVKWFGKTNWFKKMWKGTLDRMVAKLQAQGVESAPYNDQVW